MKSDQEKGVDSHLEDGAPASEEYVIKKRPMWPFFAVLFAIVGTIGGGLYWFFTRPDPFKVLVAIEVNGQWWEGSRPAASIADEVGEGLKKIGFEPVAGGDPKVDKVLSKAKTAEEAARKLGAGFVVSGSLSPEVIEHPVEGGLVEVRTKTVLSVRFIGDKDGVASEVPIEAWASGATKEAALAKLAETVSQRVFDGALPRMVDHDVIKSKLTAGDLNAVVRLNDAQKYVESRARRLDIAKKAYAKLDQEHADANGPRPIEYLGSFDEQDYLAGVGQAGALIQTGDVSPFIVPSTLDMGWIYELETLSWRGADRKDKVLWSGYHLMGYASAAPEGFPIVFVEDLFGRAKTLTVVDQNGTSRRLRVDPNARFDDPEVSSGGKYAALYERACRRCGRSFSVIRLDDGKAAYVRAAASDQEGEEAAESYGGYAWLDDHQVAYIVKGKPLPVDPADPTANVEDPGEELRVVDLAADPPVDRLVSHVTGQSCSNPSADPKSSRVVMTCSSPDGWVLTFVDTKSGERSQTTTPGSRPTFSPDGARVAFERRGDVWVYDTAKGEAVRLTENEFAERLPRFSADGRRVLFESQSRDPNFSSRIVSVIASVEAP